MDIYKFIHIVIHKLKYLIAIPLLAGILMFVITQNQPRIYSARASIFTAITSNFSIDNLRNNRVDFFATKTAYNNLISILSSRSVIEETSLRLFAMHLMLDKANPVIISEKSFEGLQQIIPDEIRKLVVKGNEVQSYENLLAYMTQDKHNFLYGLLNYDHPHYSYKAISEKIKINQVGSSDIVELNYELNDPGIVFQTLKILIEVFIREYSILKKSQTNAVVEYFENQLSNSSIQLNLVEDNLLAFNKENNIINYYEQTKFVSSQQEKIEVKLQEVLMEFQSADAILKKLEFETQARFKININTKDILDLRKLLITVKHKLVQLELDKSDSLQSSPLALELNEMELRLNIELQGKIDSLYIYGRNSEGISIETLLNNWLNTVIEYEGSKARLMAMEAKNEEFAKLYSKYAPLGAMLKRIEREIDVKEKEYLEILHHLGLAKLKQQNEEMMANMKILDHPQLPIDPESTKRKLYVAIIGIFSFIFTLLGFLVYELLDRTIKSPKRFEKIAKLSVVGVAASERKYKGLDFTQLNIAGLKLVSEAIVNAKNQDQNKPVVVQFISHWQGEGKTHIITWLKQQLKDLGYAVSSINFQELELLEDNESALQFKQIYDIDSYDELIQTDAISGNSEIVLVEVPAVSNQLFNTKLLATASLTYLVTDARRSWTSADDFIIKKQKSYLLPDFEGILNFVYPDEMAELIGEIPKKRSWLRRFVKSIVFGSIRSGNK